MAETSQSLDAKQPTAETFVNAASGTDADVGVNLLHLLFLAEVSWLFVIPEILG